MFKRGISSKMCEALLEKEKAQLSENRFSESAPHLFLKLRPADALLDILNIIFILPTASFGPRSLVNDCR